MLYEVLSDPLFSPALEAFFSEQTKDNTDALLRAVRQPIRDTMKEARLAGKVEAYENALQELRHFAQEQLKEARQ